MPRIAANGIKSVGLSVRLPEPVHEALRSYVASAEPSTTLNRAIETLVRQGLTAKGFLRVGEKR